MIPLREFAWMIYSCPPEKRRIVFFRFCSDESYNGSKDDPNTFTTSGFFSDQPTWEEVENRWSEINRKYGVPRFHAQHLNRKEDDNEYKGWCKCKRDSYSAELLDALNEQGKRMRAYNCGMHADAYREVISPEGREKLGPAWMACFKSCVAMIAKDMDYKGPDPLPSEDRFAVLFERGSGFDIQAVETFERMVANPKFEHRHRLHMCAPITPELLIGVQVADLMAFEYFKRLDDREKTREPRIPWKRLCEHHEVIEEFYGRATLTRLKEQIESAVCEPGGLVIIPELKYTW